MFDGPTAAVIVTGILGFAAPVTVALLKLLPARGAAAAEDKCHRRMSAIETRVAVIETNYANFGRSFDELRKEIHEMRQELRLLTGRSRGSTGEP
jgi:uncharacterized coiled-coil protein SlyX